MPDTTATMPGPCDCPLVTSWRSTWEQRYRKRRAGRRSEHVREQSARNGNGAAPRETLRVWTAATATGSARPASPAFLAPLAAAVAGIAATSRFSGAVSSAMNGVAGAIPVVNEIAPTSGWRIYAVDPPMPRADPATYRLKIGGRVAKPVELSLADLAAMPTVEQVSDFHCVTGGSVPGVRWRGLRPQTLTDLVQPAAGIRQVMFRSLEGPYV